MAATSTVTVASAGAPLGITLLAILVITAVAAFIANRYLDRSGPDDERRADVLGDIAYLKAAAVEDCPTATLRWQLTVCGRPPHA